MRIVVANTQAPFVYGGAEFHADNLVSNLRKAGHEVDLVRIPFNWNPPRKILDQILAVRLLDVTESFGQPVDLVIGLKFPAYFLKHSNKVLWILHQHRLAYEQWQPGAMGLDGGAEVRDSIVRADNTFILEARKVFANSKTVAARLKKYNGIDATVLYHPPPGHEQLRPGEYGNYIFFPSRLAEIKRQHLAVEAMRKVRSDVRLVIAGPPESEDYGRRLASMVEQYGLEGRVELLGPVTEERKRELYADALAVLYPPKDEDYGYVTLEGFHCAKPVITCTDSAGPLEFVHDGQTGMVCEPAAQAVAEAIERLATDRGLAAACGRQGLELIRGLDMSWEKVVESLTS
ncbi:MAG: putative glycosyl transferase [Proteobacteria bacterium]|nr:putative glycosyl transferase [Pseudomonadota bacterium]